MELNYQDSTAKNICEQSENQVVGLVHKHSGLASMANISYDPNREALKIETAKGSFFANIDLTDVLS